MTTVTQYPSGSDTVGTVLIESPYLYTTIRSQYTGTAPVTITQYPSGSDAYATVIINEPYSFTTATTRVKSLLGVVFTPSSFFLGHLSLLLGVFASRT